MKRIALFLYVNLDLVPGAFHTADSALLNVRQILEARIDRCKPTAGFAPRMLQPAAYGRVAIVIYVDLDPSQYNDKHRALCAVRNVVRDAILHYYPVVSYAPEFLQPENYAEESIVK